jgi:hypothetical protein
MPRFNNLPLSEQLIVSLRCAEWLATASADLFLPDLNAGDLLTAMTHFNIEIGRNGVPHVDEFLAMIDRIEAHLPSECGCLLCKAKK